MGMFLGVRFVLRLLVAAVLVVGGFTLPAAASVVLEHEADNGQASKAQLNKHKSKPVAPGFSHGSGFYPNPFELVITHPDPEVQIYYTLDGSEPDPDNLEGKTFRYKNAYSQVPGAKPDNNFFYQEYKTYLYENPLRIEDRTWQPDRLSQIATTRAENSDYFPKPELADHWLNDAIFLLNRVVKELNRAIRRVNGSVDKLLSKGPEDEAASSAGAAKPAEAAFIPFIPQITYRKKSGRYLFKGTPVKAVAVKAGIQKSGVVSIVLFVGERSQFSLPLINITVPEKDLFDYDDGIWVAGKTYDQWLEGLENNEKLPRHPPANWRRTPRTGDKLAAHITFFSNNNIYELPAKILPHGGYTRQRRNKSVRLYLNQRELVKNPPDIFNDGLMAGYRINLRSAGQASNTSYMHDAVVHQLAIGLNMGLQRYAPQLVFVNGEYKGILNARDRKDSHYLQQRYSLPDRNLDLLKSNARVDHGDAGHYQAMLAQWEAADKPSPEFYRLAERQVDLSSFTDYFVLSIYLGRKDWPGNNIAFWRYKGAEVENNPVTDGRWRWLLYDADSSFNATHETLLRAAGQAPDGRLLPWATFLFSSLLENPTYQARFITRFSDLLNSWFQPERVAAIIHETQARLEPEMPRHIHRWNQPKTMEEWHKHVGALVQAAHERPQHQWQHLQSFFGLDDPVSLTVNVSQAGAGKVQLNSLILGDDPEKLYAVTEMPLFLPWSGQYFKGLPLALEARPAPGHLFSHWQVAGYQLDETQKNSPRIEIRPTSALDITAVMVKAP